MSWFGLLGLLSISFNVYSQKGQQKWPNSHNDCDGNCFSANVVSAKPGTGGCTIYEIRITHDGTCRYDLSHATIEIPCGTVSSVVTPGGYEFGKDPTTGLYGLKITGGGNFGSSSPTSFTVKFNWCNSSSCLSASDCWQPRVAFKAATCIDYDTASNTCVAPPLKATVQKQSVSCSGNTDGTLSVTAEGGEGPYTYSWSTGCTSSSIENLPEGTYTVTVTDAAGNQVTLTQVITATSNIALSAATVNPTCSNGQNGSIDLSVSGGVAPYFYAWSNGATSQDLTGLSIGSYHVMVTDSMQCSRDAVFQLTSPAISIAAQTTRPGCGQANGALDITVTGGTAPYSYQWTNGSTAEDQSGLPAGLYTVTVTDANGCTSKSSFVLTENNTLHINFAVTPTACTGNGTGAIDLTVSGGTAPYTYAWDNGSTTQDLTGLAAGPQHVTVTDAGGCITSTTINVPSQSFQVQSQVTRPTCFGTQDGSITLTPKGVPPYTYLWSTGAVTSSISNLASGLYSVTVTDSTGCSQSLSFFVSDPLILGLTTVSNSQCGAEGNFSIDLTPSGGVAPYTYIWSTGATTQDVSGLNSGTYQVTITDSNGCAKTIQVIVQPIVIDWSCSITPPLKNPVCGSSGNQLSTAVTGATYLWSVQSQGSQWAITSGQQTPTVTYQAGPNGTTAIFSLSVTKNGCTQMCSYTLTGCSPVMSCGPVNTAAPTDVSSSTQSTEQPATSGSTTKPEFSVVAYPNPVMGSFSIDWKAEANEYVRVDLIDLCGRRVAEMYSGYVTEGEDYRINWNASDLTEQWYVYRYSSSTRTVYGKLIKSH